MDILIGLLTVVHVIIALFLLLLVLMQKSQDQGVGAAFGGGIAEGVLGGSMTPLVKMTVYCAVGLLVTSVSLGLLHSKRGPGNDSIMKETATATAPAATEVTDTNAVPVVSDTNAAPSTAEEPAAAEPSATEESATPSTEPATEPDAESEPSPTPAPAN